MRNLTEFPIEIAEMARAVRQAQDRLRAEEEAADPTTLPLGSIEGPALAELAKRLERLCEIAARPARERANLMARLLGYYALGPHVPNGEPEFGWRQFQGTPIQTEAVLEISRLHQALRSLGAATGRGIDAEALIEDHPGMLPMAAAPRDGTPVLVQVKSDLSQYGVDETDRMRGFLGIKAVMRNRGNLMDWSFAAPVGVGGFPDEWLEGWWPLPEHAFYG